MSQERVKNIDNKFSMYVGANNMPVLAKRLVNGALVPIPDDEPLFLFRARDTLALPTLQRYMGLCLADGCTNLQIESLRGMIDRFAQFAAHNPGAMKQPGLTMGI